MDNLHHVIYIVQLEEGTTASKNDYLLQTCFACGHPQYSVNIKSCCYNHYIYVQITSNISLEFWDRFAE